MIPGQSNFIFPALYLVLFSNLFTHHRFIQKHVSGTSSTLIPQSYRTASPVSNRCSTSNLLSSEFPWACVAQVFGVVASWRKEITWKAKE